MADSLRLSASLLAKIVKPLIEAKIPLASLRGLRASLGLANPVRELEHVYRTVKAQVAALPGLQHAAPGRVIPPALFTPSLGALSKKFMYGVTVTLRDPGTGEVSTQTISILSSRRLTKNTAVSQAIERLVNPPLRARDYGIRSDDVLGAEVDFALDRDL